MQFLLSLLASKTTWVVIAAAVVAIALGAQHARINYLKGAVQDRDEQIAIAKAELEQAKVTLVRWREAFDNLTVTIDEQNKKISALEREARRRIENARAALLAAAASREEAEALAQKITKMELSTNECTALQQLVDVSRTGGLR